jgi:hypothetical protein
MAVRDGRTPVDLLASNQSRVLNLPTSGAGRGRPHVRHEFRAAGDEDPRLRTP